MDKKCSLCDNCPSILLTSNEVEILELRHPGCNKELKHLCTGHYNKWITYYSIKVKACTDPFKSHKTPRTSRLATVSLADHHELKDVADLIPGQKICGPCLTESRKRLFEIKENDQMSPEILTDSQGFQTGSQEYRLSFFVCFLLEISHKKF